ncbi:MAG: protein phosphatase 2C domain-containing protein [Mycoplasmoidaceae bacterium]
MILLHETDIGSVRKDNEDKCWSGSNKFDDKFLIVCDGLGSYKGSKNAARIVVENFVSAFKEGSYQESKYIEEWFNSVIEYSRKLFALEIRLNPTYMQMATTIVATLIIKNEIHLFWMGDSRAYSINVNDFTQITKDHNLLSKLIDENYSPYFIKKFKSNLYAITSYVGISSLNLEKGYKKLSLKENEIIFLSSDGFHNFMDINKLYEKFNNTLNINLVGRELINETLSNGSDDNISFSALINIKEDKN